MVFPAIGTLPLLGCKQVLAESPHVKYQLSLDFLGTLMLVARAYKIWDDNKVVRDINSQQSLRIANPKCFNSYSGPCSSSLAHSSQANLPSL